MRLLSYIFPKPTEHSGSIYNKDIAVKEYFGHWELYVNGIQQSGDYVNELFRSGIEYLSPWRKGFMKHILVLGVGGGGVLFLLRRKYPDAHITAVDIDAEIVRLGKKYFEFDAIGRCSFVISDARDFLKEKKYSHQYDLIVVDLYIGNDVPEFVSESPFLAGLKRLLRRGGGLMINYFSFYNQPEKSKILLDKLSKIYQSVDRKKNLRNIFFFCK